jgi:hypothetical protein
VASLDTPAALAPEHIGRRNDVVPAPAPDAVEPRRPRDRISLADVIFKALCLLISSFVVLVLGIVVWFLYLIS